MSVWVCVPSKRPPAEVKKWAQAWRDMGYRIALWRESMDLPYGIVDYLRAEPEYPGYAAATNRLIADVPQVNAQWAVIGGDDVFPDTTKRADEIAAECEGYFRNKHTSVDLRTFGVMQPTGDRWHEGRGGFKNAPIDRVAGSAWIGREFALRTYGGNGPLWPGYFHNFVDEELQCVAEKLGVFWQRRDLTQKHLNWARGETDQELVDAERIPEFLTRANSPEEWDAAKRMFNERKQRGFPGHEVKA